MRSLLDPAGVLFRLKVSFSCFSPVRLSVCLYVCALYGFSQLHFWLVQLVETATFFQDFQCLSDLPSVSWVLVVLLW